MKITENIKDKIFTQKNLNSAVKFSIDSVVKILLTAATVKFFSDNCTSDEVLWNKKCWEKGYPGICHIHSAVMAIPCMTAAYRDKMGGIFMASLGIYVGACGISLSSFLFKKIKHSDVKVSDPSNR